MWVRLREGLLRLVVGAEEHLAEREEKGPSRCMQRCRPGGVDYQECPH